MAISATDLMGLGMPPAQAKYLADGITFGDAAQGDAIADLGGSLTGTTDGDLADVADIALSTSNTYTDAAVNSAVNTAIAAANLQIKELQEKMNDALAALRAAGIIAT